MKLNYKRTILVGFAFFLICAFWQAYDTIIPKILTDKFGMPQAYSGIVMALDNILALFMLPIFGAISDKANSKMGRRTPFILVGTIVAVIAFVGLGFADNMQLTNISDVSEVGGEQAMSTLYGYDYPTVLKTPEGEQFDIKELFTEEEFCAISTDSVEIVATEDGKQQEVNLYSEYVVPARQAYAWQRTLSNTTPLFVFMGILLVVLLAMATFRSPAVALMPDVTIKPLRSQGNAIINLMGTAGGMLVLVLGIVFATGTAENAMMKYFVFFGVVAAIMILALVIFLITVNEPKLVAQMKEDSKRFGIDEAEEKQTGGNIKLSAGELASLLLILASVIFWFMGYNAVTSKYSVYAPNVLGLDYNTTLLIANGAAIISYLPVGFISAKLGRKKTIIAGVIMLCAAFAIASTLRSGSSALMMNCMFALAGIGWATINVNSFPMVVELSKNSDVGKYTGFYYTASMAAQTITPYISGSLMDNYGMTILFPYAAVMVALAFVTMIFVTHGDNKPEQKRSMIENFDVDD